MLIPSVLCCAACPGAACPARGCLRVGSGWRAPEGAQSDGRICCSAQPKPELGSALAARQTRSGIFGVQLWCSLSRGDPEHLLKQEAETRGRTFLQLQHPTRTKGQTRVGQQHAQQLRGVFRLPTGWTSPAPAPSSHCPCPPSPSHPCPALQHAFATGTSSSAIPSLLAPSPAQVSLLVDA